MSIFDAPILPSVPETDHEERITYSIWIRKPGERAKEVKWSDSWNVIQRYWAIVKTNLKKSNPIKSGYIIAELRFWRTNSYVYERRTNRKGYLIKLLYGPGHGMELFVTKEKIAMYYARKFRRAGNAVEIYKCYSAKLNSWITIKSLTPAEKKLKEQYEAALAKPFRMIVYKPFPLILLNPQYKVNY